MQATGGKGFQSSQKSEKTRKFGRQVRKPTKSQGERAQTPTFRQARDLLKLEAWGSGYASAERLPSNTQEAQDQRQEG